MINTGKLAGKTLYITGASRGIGKAIALKAAKDGANIVVAAKTADPHPKLPGTIFTAAKEIEEAGGQALPCVVDVRDEGKIQKSIEEAVKQFGGLDILINNASAISLTGTESTTMKKYDLMNQINARGTFLVSKLALPYLKTSKSNPHILNLSPPLNLNPRWFKNNLAYTMAKYGMSMCVLGMAEEFKKDNIGVNALWPKTAIYTAAMEMLGGGDGISASCRTPDIMADAAYVILTRSGRDYTGNFVVDEEILKEEGCKDFDQYACKPGSKLLADFFLDEYEPQEHEILGVSKKAERERQINQSKNQDDKTGSVKSVSEMFEQMKSLLNEDLVKKIKATYAFEISGSESGKYFVDLKTGSGSCGSGELSEKADVTFIMKDQDLVSMFAGSLQPASAYMSGKMKLKGDISKAMQLDKIMKKMRK